MMYYLGLMIGRFVYFDASFKDFIDNMKKVIMNSPILLMYILYTFILVYIGFKAEYFLERNYYIVGVFHSELFMIFVVFLLFWLDRIIRCGTSKKKQKTDQNI